MTLESLKVDGGMVGNDLLMQFQADLLGVPVIRPKVPETTSLGAAYAAGLATGFWGEVEDLRENWVEDKRWEPSMDADEARRVLQVLEAGRHADVRLVRRRRGLSGGVTGRRAPAPPRVARALGMSRRAQAQLETDVLVVGGGATGAGVAWDAALRGFDVVLVERGDLAEGTSGRFHGLLHSGGRYVVKDPVTAEECVVENAILRDVIPDCIEDTGGLFVTTPDDDPAYADRFLEGCRAAKLPAEEIDVGEALRREPRLNPGIRRAFTVPDASIDAGRRSGRSRAAPPPTAPASSPTTG